MDQIRKVVLAQCEGLSTPRALSVAILARYGEWAQLQQLRLRSPSEYLSADHYKKDALATELLRKCKLDTGNDTEQAAHVTFWASETHCASSNARLSRFLPESMLIESIPEDRVVHFIDEWRKEIRLAVGSLPGYLTPRFSGGSTYADVGKLITIPDKMSSVPTVYQDSQSLLPFFWETSWGRAVCRRREIPEVVRGNIFFTVPKDSDKDRGCCKEASIPVSLQLDVGQWMRRGLLSGFGIDLKHDQDLHRKLAQKASVDGLKATIDMSNASDTVCRVLVKLALVREPMLYSLLDSLRAPMTRIRKDGKDVWVKVEKFSSMGNGFTFELETLLFASMARAVCRVEGGDPFDVNCYGDDLIVPTEHAASVLSALRFFGFVPNEKKSFKEGPFRESCGGDFYDGKPVRAHYLKELPDEPQHWIALANGFRRVDPDFRWLKRAWNECLTNIPSAIRKCRGPESLGDLVIHDAPEYWNSITDLRGRLPQGDDTAEGWESQVHFRTYKPVNTRLDWHHWSDDVVLASTTLGPPSSGVIPRGSIAGYKLAWVLDPTYSRWIPKGASKPLGR
jgi:hypothetical protein